MILKRGKGSWIGRFRYHYRKYNLNQIEVFLTQPGHISIICCNNVFFIVLMKNCSLWLVAQLDHHHLSSSRKQRYVKLYNVQRDLQCATCWSGWSWWESCSHRRRTGTVKEVFERKLLKFDLI